MQLFIWYFNFRRWIIQLFTIGLLPFFSVCICAGEIHHLQLFDLNKQYPSKCDDPVNQCYTVEDLIKRALEFGLDSRQHVQLLFQARKAVKVKMGEILPKLNFTSIAVSVMDRSVSLDTILPFVGFIFPGRWFEWKSARYLRDSQQELLRTILANSAMAIQEFYYDIQMQIWSIRIIEFYIDEIVRLIVFLKNQQKAGLKKATAEDIAVLENIKAKFIYDRAFVDALSADLPQIATIIGLEPNFDWSHLIVKPCKFRSLKKKTRREYLEFWPDAVDRSSEIKNVEHLIVAANYDKKSTYVNFFDPASGYDLGFGYGQRIKLARSNIDVLNIELQRTKMQLSNGIHNALNNYNDSVESFKGIQAGLDHLEDIRSAVNDHVNNMNVPLDINRLIRHFEYAEGQALRFVNSYFVLRTAEADLNRYTWRGKIYRIVNEHMTKVPHLLEAINKKYSLRRTLKNKFLKKFRRGIL